MNRMIHLGAMRHKMFGLLEKLRRSCVWPKTNAVGRTGERLDFVCNICGQHNRGIPMVETQGRETPSCRYCGSTLRFRSVIHALSTELFGESLALPKFPVDKTQVGIGMSDFEGYAHLLASKLSYVNTFYHKEPRLDITEIPESEIGKYRYLISSDVFEHIPISGLDAAFANSRRILGTGGFLILTVPYAQDGSTREHFPRLNEYEIRKEHGQYVLNNRTLNGDREVFRDLIFHGGPGATLEMRLFSKPDLTDHLHKAGFASIRFSDDETARFGILWPHASAVPIIARA